MKKIPGNSLQEVFRVLSVQACLFEKNPGDIYYASLHLKMDGLEYDSIYSISFFKGPLLNAYFQGQTCAVSFRDIVSLRNSGVTLGLDSV